MATKKYVSPSKLSVFLEKLKDVFAVKDHTHNYAGASSSGGAATSANKLNTNAGSGTQPVFFQNGVPVATTYTLGKSVPSDAKFTDTTYPAATTTDAGLMSASDKTKLNGIATGANKTTVDSTLSSTSTNPVQNKVINTALSGKANSSHTHTMSEVTDADSYEFITVDEIDEICGTTILSADEAVF